MISTFLLSNYITVYANGGPPQSLVDGDVEFLIPVKHTSVEIISEQLLYNLNDFVDETMLADITAIYEMSNTSGESVDVLIAFVTNNSTCPLEILFRGEPVEILKTETLDWNKYPIDRNYIDMSKRVSRDWGNYDNWKEFGVWEPTFKEIMFYFSTGDITESFDPSGNYALEVTLFDINFNPNEVCELAVSYTEKSAFITDNFNYYGGSGHNPRFQFYYLLEPAQYWKDFRNLSITVEMPQKLKTEFSLDGFAFNEESNLYTAHFDNLPDKNLEILVYKHDKIETPNRISSIGLFLIGGVVIFFIIVLVIAIIIVRKIMITLKNSKRNQ